MSRDEPPILCARCARPLTTRAGRPSCAGCGAAPERVGGELAYLDLRDGTADPAPEPLAPGELDGALARLDGGAPFKETLEALLLELPGPRADRLMQLLKEARGAWAALLAAGAGSALVIGNALAGTASPLAAGGLALTVLDPCGARLRFAAHRLHWRPGRAARWLRADDGAPLPFADRAFDVVVLEAGVPGAAVALDEARRVCAGELALTADNRLAYKRSSGERGVFHVPGPLGFLRSAARPAPGERTLPGHRRALSDRGFERARAFALYPHRRDYAQVVALDAPRPALPIGPQERRNRLKVAARALGLFPLLTPSYALLARRTGGTAPEGSRAERVLRALARRLDEPTPEVESWIATRDDAAIWLTAVPGGEAGAPAGRWAVHVPLGRHQVEQMRSHWATLQGLAREHPGLAPEPLFQGELEGLLVTCERRLPGRTAPQLAPRGERRRRVRERLLADAARALAELLGGPARPVDERAFDELLGAKFELVLRHVAGPAERRVLDSLRERARALLLGRPLRRALCHGDLRGKHVQVRADGALVGLLDWGTAEAGGLPYHDLLHLVVHERKQELGGTPGDAWRALCGRGEARPEESAALDDYARRAELDGEARRALELCYPAVVAWVAEANWDYSRPRWIERQFQLARDGGLDGRD